MRSRGPAGTAARSERLGEPSLQKFSQFRGRRELRNRLHLLEGRSKRSRQTPDQSRAELSVLRFEVEIVYGPCQMFWCSSLPSTKAS